MNLDDSAKWLEWVAKQFESIAGADQEINLQEFKTALKSFFAERFFALFDSDGSGTISLDELLDALKLLIHGSEADKLWFLFRVYDVDGSGSIDPNELRTVLKWCLKESSISLPEEKLDDLTVALFESADSDKSGSITFEELREELERFPEVMENLTISAASWLKPPSAPRKIGTPRYLSPAYWHNNKSKLLFLGSYTAVNILLCVFAALKHTGSGAWIMLAKGCGQCLNFNCTFIVVLMLRRCLTWLRATWVAKILPLDQNVMLHEVVGYVIATVSAVHTGAHVANFVRLSWNKDGYHLWEYLFTPWPGIGWIYGMASITGIVLQLLIILMLVCSSAFVRKAGHFEVFYWSHLSYVFIWALLIVHGPNFWKWFVAPGFLFLLEKIFGVASSHIGGLYIVEMNLLPSKVTHLVIKRPHFFHYKPGDYVYLNIPVIAKYEWHPFTISSAPEQPETIWLHIRSLGQWTSKLYAFVKHYHELPDHKEEWPAADLRKKDGSWKWVQKSLYSFYDLDQPVATNEDEMVEILSYTPTQGAGWEIASLSVGSRREEANTQSREGKTSVKWEVTVINDLRIHMDLFKISGSVNHRPCNIKCYIDGPYGTPTRRIFTSEHAVLIGAGIGITPFASILQSIMYRYHMRKQTTSSQSYLWGENLKNEEMKLRKVDFIWINRDQKSFEWFVSLLTKLEIDQADEDPCDRFLEMHLYMTSALSKNDMKAIGLQMALELLAKKENKDSITGLKTRTQPGHPDWSKIFQQLAKENKGKVHVFFCGSPALAKVIKAQCEQFNFQFFKEHF